MASTKERYSESAPAVGAPAPEAATSVRTSAQAPASEGEISTQAGKVVADQSTPPMLKVSSRTWRKWLLLAGILMGLSA